MIPQFICVDKFFSVDYTILSIFDCYFGHISTIPADGVQFTPLFCEPVPTLAALLSASVAQLVEQRIRNA